MTGSMLSAGSQLSRARAGDDLFAVGWSSWVDLPKPEESCRGLETYCLACSQRARCTPIRTTTRRSIWERWEVAKATDLQSILRGKLQERPTWRVATCTLSCMMDRCMIWERWAGV